MALYRLTTEYDPLSIPIGNSGKTALEVAREAAKLAGKLAKERFEGEKGIRFKRPGDVVTDVDTEAEARIFDLIQQEFPNHTLVGEESASDVRADEGYAWIVDPVDGTRNYSVGLPIYSTVVGLALDGEVLVGVNYDPERDDLFEAERGAGAYLNGKPIHVSKKTELKDCIIGFDLPYSDMARATSWTCSPKRSGRTWERCGASVRPPSASRTQRRVKRICTSSTVFHRGTWLRASSSSKRRAAS